MGGRVNHPGYLLLRHHAAGHRIGLILLVVIVVALAVLVWQNARRHRQPSPAGVDPAVAELRMRYARGEISREDYVARSNDLGHRPAESRRLSSGASVWSAMSHC